MAVVSVTEIKERTGKISFSNGVVSRTYTRVFAVECDTPTESAIVVALHGDIPQLLTAYPGDLASKVIDIDPQQTSDDGYRWEVTVSYGKVDTDDETDPLEQDIQVDWDFQQFERPFNFDADGKPVVNKATDPFAEALMRDDSRLILTITRNEESFNERYADAYCDAINGDVFSFTDRSDDVHTFRPRTVKVSSIKGSSQEYQGSEDEETTVYWRVTYVFHIKKGGWNKYVLNRGFRERVAIDPEPEEGASHELKNIIIDGVAATEPVLLDEDGLRLAVGEDPIVLEFQPYHELPFSVFDF